MTNPPTPKPPPGLAAPGFNQTYLDIVVRAYEFMFIHRYKHTTKQTNKHAAARYLKLNIRTYMRMRNGEDDWPWWPYIMIEAIAQGLPRIEYWKRSPIHVILRQLPKEMIKPIERNLKAYDWLNEQLRDGPKAKKQIQHLANHSMIPWDKVIRAAAMLGVTKVRMSFGDKHRSFWQLPDYEE